MLHENLFWSGSRLQDIHPRNSSLLWSFCLFLFLISQVKVILSLIISGLRFWLFISVIIGLVHVVSLSRYTGRSRKPLLPGRRERKKIRELWGSFPTSIKESQCGYSLPPLAVMDCVPDVIFALLFHIKSLCNKFDSMCMDIHTHIYVREFTFIFIVCLYIGKYPLTHHTHW